MHYSYSRRIGAISLCLALFSINPAFADESASRWTGLPGSLLWRPMLANPQQPRMSARFTTLNTQTLDDVIDTSIGGQMGIVRFTSPDQRFRVQPDVFAVAISRFSQNAVYTETDFRVGSVITLELDNRWHAKIGYEHASTHLGDDFIERTGEPKIAHIRDEIQAGIDYVFAEQLRVYGQFGYAVHFVTSLDTPHDRYGVGVEWSHLRSTGWKGQPFAAADVEFRGDQDYTPNLTLQAGWEWRKGDSHRSLRFGLEYYDGGSPFGQFYRQDEHWFALAVWMDI